MGYLGPHRTHAHRGHRDGSGDLVERSAAADRHTATCPSGRSAPNCSRHPRARPPRPNPWWPPSATESVDPHLPEQLAQYADTCRTSVSSQSASRRHSPWWSVKDRSRNCSGSMRVWAPGGWDPAGDSDRAAERPPVAAACPSRAGRRGRAECSPMEAVHPAAHHVATGVGSFACWDERHERRTRRVPVIVGCPAEASSAGLGRCRAGAARCRGSHHYSWRRGRSAVEWARAEAEAEQPGRLEGGRASPGPARRHQGRHVLPHCLPPP